MNNDRTIELIKLLAFDLIEQHCESPEFVKGVYATVKAIENVAEKETKDKDEEEVPEEKPKKRSTRKPPVTEQKKVDVGKTCACYKAGWSLTKIADEVGTTITTVNDILKREGLKK